ARIDDVEAPIPGEGTIQMSTITAPSDFLTPGDVLELPDGVRYELVDGRFVGNHCEPIGLAYILSESGYTCFPDKPGRMRRPDVSCVRTDRLRFDQIG